MTEAKFGGSSLASLCHVLLARPCSRRSADRASCPSSLRVFSPAQVFCSRIYLQIRHRPLVALWFAPRGQAIFRLPAPTLDASTAALLLAVPRRRSKPTISVLFAPPSLTPWPQNLFILWLTPAVMMLLPLPTERTRHIDWQLVLDFASVGSRPSPPIAIFLCLLPLGKPRPADVSFSTFLHCICFACCACRRVPF